MEAKAIVTGVSVTPRKARLVVDLIRGRNVEDAINILNNTDKAVSPIILKLVNSAAANATNNNKMTGTLYISKIYANDGPRLKRFLPRAKGSASGLVKRMCEITCFVSEREGE